MGIKKPEPKLLPHEQIDRLKEKGILFNYISSDDATKFLSNNNNYFKLTSYRKNFDRVIREDGESIYVNLDFQHLIELSRIDMLLRYQLLKMCLDIEHNLKVGLIRRIELNTLDDGYCTVNEFIASRDEEARIKIIKEIGRNAQSVYYWGLLKKHDITGKSIEIKDFPVWAFIEVISFGAFIEFMIFYYAKYKIPNKGLWHLLNKVKQTRNAAAHNTCMLNNLYSVRTGAEYEPHRKVLQLMSDAGVKEAMRTSKAANEVLYQIAVVFYVHQMCVTSESTREKRYGELFDLMNKNQEVMNLYFSKNDLITSSFDMLYKVTKFLNEGCLHVDTKTK